MLDTLDLRQKLPKEEFKQLLPDLRHRLAALTRAAHERQVPCVVVFEGWECSGKGAAIQLLTERLDARGFKVHAIAPPTREERLQPWLMRFWMRVPRRGQMAIFDRSWYGLVLRDRVDKTISKAECEACYPEVREFETALVDDGTLVVKLFMHISEREQARRLKKLSKHPLHRFLIDDDDWAEHERYKAHERAVRRMVERTSTAAAPWTLIEADDRRFAFHRVYATLIDAYERALELRTEAP